MPKHDFLSPPQTGRADFPHLASTQTLAARQHVSLNGCNAPLSRDPSGHRRWGKCSGHLHIPERKLRTSQEVILAMGPLWRRIASKIISTFSERVVLMEDWLRSRAPGQPRPRFHTYLPVEGRESIDGAIKPAHILPLFRVVENVYHSLDFSLHSHSIHNSLSLNQF